MGDPSHMIRLLSAMIIKCGGRCGGRCGEVRCGGRAYTQCLCSIAVCTID